MPTRLLLARHGETTANAQNRLAGHADVALTANGRRQARALSRRLRQEPIAAAYASDMNRARETASLALRGRGVELRVEPRLREFWFGDWEEKTFDEIRSGWPEEFARLLAVEESFCAPGGEPLVDTRTRVLESVAEIASGHLDESVLVVAHSGTIQIVLAHALGMPVENLFRLRLGNCSLSVIEFHGERPLITLINDCAHAVPRAAHASTAARRT